MKPQLHTLKNGLRILLVDTKAFSSLTVLLLVAAGSRYENNLNNGVAHFFEHMAFKGSKKYPDSLTIATILDGLGSEHNAFTAKDHTGYWIKAPTANFTTLVDILSDMLLTPLLKEEEIEREKGVIIEEINMYEDTPQYKVWDLFESMLYPNNPLGYDTLGKKETVLTFNRQTFQDYMGRHYQPSNAALVVAGSLTQSSNLKTQNHNSKVKTYQTIIEEKFGRWKNKQIESFDVFLEKQSKPEILVYPKKTEQAHLVLGYRGLKTTDERKYVQAVLMTLLGGGMSSRLFYQVRERRGLCYYISSGSETFAETGYVFTRAGINIDVKKIKEAIKVIVDEHEKISQGKIEEKEITKAKEMLKGRLMISLEDSNNVASFFGKRVLLERELKSPEEVIGEIEKVTKEEITGLAANLFVKIKQNLAIIGPFKSEDFII